MISNEAMIEQEVRKFKAFSHLKLPAKAEALKRWYEGMDAREKKETDLLIWVMVVKERMLLNRLREIDKKINPGQ